MPVWAQLAISTLIPLAPLGLVWAQIDPNPETPTSILAAVIFLGTVIVAGETWALRVLWKKIEALQEKVELRDAAATNRERTLGQEVFPMVKQMTDVLAATIRNQVHRLEQHPPQTLTSLDPAQLRRIADALES